MNEDVIKRREKNPREDAGLSSIFTFAWLHKIFSKGYRRDLELSDLYCPLNEHSSRFLGSRVSREWEKEVKKCQGKEQATPSLVKVLVKCFGRSIIIGGLVQAILEFLIRMTRPYLLLRMLHHFNVKRGEEKYDAYYWGMALALSIFLDCMIAHNCVHNLMHVGMKIRVACSSLIYRKILRIPVTFSESDTSVGQVMNLVSNDVSRLDSAIYYIHYIWMAPLQVILVSYFLYTEVDRAAFAGILLQFLFMPLQGFFGKLANQLTNKYASRTDLRLSLTKEIISGIRAIKMHAWEKPFSQLVEKARKRELKIVKIDSITTDISLASEYYIPRLCVFVTTMSYVLLGNKISAERVYIVTAFYDVVRMSMYTLFPMALHDLAESLVSLKRLQKFLLLEDLPGPSIQKLDSKTAVSMKNASAKWSSSSDISILCNLNLSVKSCSLTVIVGQVGSGKSSLLHMILRELIPTSGELNVSGRVSYCSQEPWIFGSTVRQNIVFSQNWDEKRYNQILDVCQLRQDINGFPLGDKTFVGEKGSNLSGGQCARINLARAIYAEADIYLLDDPLSAVDASVGRRIFEDCVKRFLREKTVFLVTHQFQYLNDVDRILVMENGCISADGTFGELQESGLNLAEVMRTIEDSENQSKNLKRIKRQSTSIVPTDFIHQNYSSKTAVNVDDAKRFDEKKVEGSVTMRVYHQYFTACRSSLLLIGVFVVSALHQISVSGDDYFVAFWVNQEELANNDTSSPLRNLDVESREWYIYTYSGITLATIVLSVLQSWTFYEMSMRISKNLHSKMFSNVICATVDFFSYNPLGRIMNRFSKDIANIDTEVSRTMIDVVQTLIHIVAVLIVVSTVNPWLVLPAFFVGILFYLFAQYFLRTSRNIKRLEGITRSLIFNHISDTLHGLTTIRALGAQKTLVKEFDADQDLHSSSWFIFFSGSRGLGMYLDLLCCIFLTSAMLILISFKERTLAGDIGLVITQCMLLINTLQWGVRQFAELENQMISVERVFEYTNLSQEDVQLAKVKSKKEVNGLETKKPMNGHVTSKELTKPLLAKVTENWPKVGKIEFKNVYLRYEPVGQTVLKNLNILIEPQEKVGIVGRTGSGKSSFVNALFRLGYLEGEIHIDNVPISTLHLHKLRSKLSIIPQEPILFAGSLRKNLDPLDEYTDPSLWQALDDVGLKYTLDSKYGLDTRVTEGGTNFSLGQRQLLCLARAMIRRNKILILDEVTANMDPYTDELIQKAVREKFNDCTVITIAHRLNSVIHSDKIIVLHDGCVVEFDHAYILLTDKKQYFYEMVEQLGQQTANYLTEMAKKSYFEKN